MCVCVCVSLLPQSLVEAVASGSVSNATLNDHASRVLYSLFTIGRWIESHY